MNHNRKRLPSPLKYSIRTRLILLFVISFIVIFSVAGYYLLWHIRGTLDEALGRNLEALAANFATTFALQFDPSLLRFVQTGDEATLTYQNIMTLLLKFQTKTGVERVYLFGNDFRSIADSDSAVKIGHLNVQLKFNQKEFEQVFKGLTASSTLFEGVDGNLYKTGYAPIHSNGTVVAGIAIEGSAEMLHVVNDIRTNLLWIGLAVTIGAIVLGSFFANRITTPLKKLESAATEISGGYLNHQIPEFGRDEVGFLAKTMEEMRQSILERDKRQQAMLAGVAHEIRNPLGGIELFAGLLASEIKKDDLKNYAQKILKEVQNLKAIIQNFIDYAKSAPANRSKCEIKSAWNEAVSLLLGDLKDFKIQFSQDDNNLSALVDPQHLKQVFLNLIKNSIEAIPNGGTIFVNLFSQGERIKILYSDTGPGILADLADKIFEPFFTTREKGTGLGLAIIKNLIGENGGSIRYVASDEGGAMFEIILQRCS